MLEFLTLLHAKTLHHLRHAFGGTEVAHEVIFKAEEELALAGADLDVLVGGEQSPELGGHLGGRDVLEVGPHLGFRRSGLGGRVDVVRLQHQKLAGRELVGDAFGEGEVGGVLTGLGGLGVDDERPVRPVRALEALALAVLAVLDGAAVSRDSAGN